VTLLDTPPQSLALRLGSHRYPVVLPKLRDPRLHLASIIITLQVLGQTSFGFDLSIAQILVSLLSCAVLEFVIVFRRHRVLAWPASALLTGNGVAFVLRVPGTQHGDWWSMRGWWIFAGTAIVSLLSKYVIRVGGRHLFNPSNFGLVLCFLLLGSSRVEPLDLWWGPMTPALAFALGLIVVGGLLILSRLRLLAIAAAFWTTFAAALAVIAVSGHCITAPWHAGPICDREFWWLLVTSPEILVFLFFMITDPKTVPLGTHARVSTASPSGWSRRCSSHRNEPSSAPRCRCWPRSQSCARRALPSSTCFPRTARLACACRAACSRPPRCCSRWRSSSPASPRDRARSPRSRAARTPPQA
jgi:hypothetical protein